MRWIWSDEKNRTNKRDHGVGFDTAQLVFEDPLAVSQQDPHEDGDRWRTLGLVGPVVLFVVHTAPDDDNAPARIISARKATSHERRNYEKSAF